MLYRFMYNDSVTDLILQTKLHAPLLRPALVQRSRLIEKLNAGMDARLILVSAQAGSGKTTLVSTWLRQTDRQTAWFSLDESDNDPRRFLAYFTAALKQIQADVGKSAEAMLQSPQPPPDEVLMTVLVNDIANIAWPLTLVIDDYHLIHTSQIHRQLNFLLEHQPQNLLLVVITREDPPLSLSRLRAHGQLTEIRQEDLRFSPTECADFLKDVMGLKLSTDDILALERRTEGWIAGLQLAALSIRGHDDVSGFIQAFTGSNRFILDYLAEEVFERQSVELKDFLLKTSILERLSGSLCDAVVGTDISRSLLEMLEQSNLFIVSLDQQRIWYRYHRLFIELLRHRLRRSDLHAAELHVRASQWYENENLIADAVHHALEAQDWARAARLIGMASGELLKRGESVTLLSWCGRLPEQVTYSSREMCMVHAWAALMTSQLEVAAPLLDRAEQLSEPNSPQLGEVASAQAFLARTQRNNARTIEKSKRALALLPEDDNVTRSIITMNLGLAYWHDGQLAEAEPALRQASDLSRATGNQFAWLTAQLFLVKTAASRGKLHEAVQMAEGLIRNGGQTPILCLAHGDLSEIYLEWNDLQKAWQHYEDLFILSQRSGNTEFIQASHLRRAMLAHAMGNDAEAITALIEADHLAHDFPAVIRSRVAAFGVQMALARKDPQLLERWQPQVLADVDAHSFYRFMGLTRPRLLIAQGNRDEAAKALHAIYDTASQAQWGYGLIVVRILQSLAVKNEADAMDFLSDALLKGQPEGFIHSFVAAGGAIIPLLREAMRRGIARDYATRILSAMGEKVASTGSGSDAMVEPLSEREKEVLKLVMSGLSNREIAARLFISAGTAKTHIHHLCGKLGVRNRTEAAMRAKELGLA